MTHEHKQEFRLKENKVGNAQKYYDADGNECSLDLLCVFDPSWAASRHRAMLARIAELERELEGMELRAKSAEGIAQMRGASIA